MANYFTDEQVMKIAEQAKLWCSESNTVFSEETRKHLLGIYKDLMNLAVSTAIEHSATVKLFNEGGSGEFKVAEGIGKLPNETKLYTVKEIS